MIRRSLLNVSTGAFLSALVAALLLALPVGALEPFNGPFHRSICPVPPVVRCPPGAPYPPLPPLPPIPSPTDPANPPGVAPPSPADTSLAQATQGGTSDFQTNAPNIFGDFLGARSSQATIRLLGPGALNNGSVTGSFSQANLQPGPTPGTVSGNLRNINFTIATANGRPVFSSMPLALPLARSGPGVGQFTENVNAPTTNAGQVNSVFQFLATPPPPALDAGINGAGPADRAALAQLQGSLFQFASAYERSVNPNAVLERFALGGVQGLYTGSELQYLAQISSQISTPVVISIPGAGSGGTVGLLKLSEDNNPLPRDRVIFNYDYFSNTPLAAGGAPVNRYQFGFEKTFLDGRVSVEVRAPFAGTVDSDTVIGQDGRNTEFGNLRLAFKGLLLRRDTVSVSTGLGVFLPTADAITLRAMDGTPLIHVDNSSTQLSPFLAVLLTPSDRLFAQAWLGWTFDTGGNRVRVNPLFFDGNQDVGALRAATLMTADFQVGYWLRRSESGLVRGLAPFAELHYNGTVSRGTVLNAGSGLRIGNTGGGYDELNLAAGVLSQLGANTTMSIGAAAPLRTGVNRSFDYQIGVRLNWYFGYTARQRSQAARVNTF